MSDEEENIVEPIKVERVELRSDGGLGLRQKAANIDKKWLVLGGVVVLLLVALIALLLATRNQRPVNDEAGFGLLPEAEDSGRRTTLSGLSGRQCEDADRRPISVMLAADLINRPVSGFADADMVWELPVLVSNVTRLLAVYQCGRPDDIGSVRSARHDYLFLAEGVDSIIGHWGGSYHALNRVAAGEFDTLNALVNPSGAFFRKNHLPAPYNGFTTYDSLWGALQDKGYRSRSEFVGYDFKDDSASDERPAGGTLSIAWPGAYRVHYEYDPVNNRYQRFWSGTKQNDGGGEKQAVAPSAVIIMRANNSFADGPGGYNDVDIEGDGALEVYQDGEVIYGTWRKDEKNKKDPVHFLDQQGDPIVFTRGQLWVMAVGPSIEVTWELVQEVEPTVSPAGETVETVNSVN